MIKVIEVISDTNIGGAGTVLLTCLKNFDRNEFDVSVALPKGSLLVPKITELGYKVHEMDIQGDESSDMSAIKEYEKLFKAERPDIVHTHAALSARIAAWKCRVKSRIYTRHSTFEPPKRLTTFPGKQLCGTANSILSTKIVAVSYSTKKNLTDTGVKDKKIKVIINGAEPLKNTNSEQKQALRAVLGIAEDETVFGMSARLEAVKGHEYFIRAAAKLIEKGLKAKFIIMGSGSEEENLYALCNELGVSDSVIFTGFVSDVSPYVALFDVIVNCSWGTEASSMALAEAMSLAKPIVASDFGGNPYMVRDGENGFITPQKDTDALAEKLMCLAEDDGLRAKMGQASLDRYNEELTGAAMTANYEKLYRDEVGR
jgi:glycosyltransferase involved in cell wall biosynthesis